MTSSNLLPSSDITQAQHENDANARRVYLHGKTAGGAFVPLLLNADGSIPQPFFNGTFSETFNALVTSDGIDITVTLTNAVSGDLTMIFSDGITTLDTTTTPLTIALTAGSDASPTENFIYIPQSTKVLTKSTSDWPSEEHIKVSYFLVPSAVFVQSNGTYVNQNWNDHQKGTDGQGHMSHIAERSRRDGAYYFSGVNPNGTTSYLTISGTTVDCKATSGIIYQMHKHTFPAVDTSIGDEILVKNWNGDAFHNITNLFDIVADSTGGSLTNRWMNIVLWGVANKSGEYEPMIINLPSGSYATQSNAEGDVDGFDDFTIPREFGLESSTGFLIARLTVRITNSSWAFGSIVDLRGQTPTIASGGASGVTTDFADNQFTIFDEIDSTKILNIDVGTNVTTGTTRTLNVPDANGTIALSSQTSGQVDISADTNLAVTSPIVLTNDTLSFDFTTANTWTGINTFNNIVSIDEGNELRFRDVGSSNYVGFEAPALTANQIWILPNTDSTGTQALISDGAGNLDWSSIPAGVFVDSFVTPDLTAGVLTVTHNLNNQYNMVQVYDNNDELIIPDTIDQSAVNSLTIDLSSFGTLTGTWHAVVAAGTIDNTGTAFPVSPVEGDKFYRTDLEEEFYWDSSRSKWLSIAIYSEASGRNGSQASGIYLRRINGMIMSATTGPPIPFDMTLVGAAFNSATSITTGNLDFRGDGVSLGTMALTGTATSDMTLNIDVTSGTIFAQITNLTTPTTITNIQVSMWLRRHAT